MTHRQLIPIRDRIKSFFKLFLIFSILFEDWGFFFDFRWLEVVYFFVGWRVLQPFRDGFGGLQARRGGMVMNKMTSGILAGGWRRMSR